MPSQPYFSAVLASSTCWMPLRISGPSQFLRRKATSSQLWFAPKMPCSHALAAPNGSSSTFDSVSASNLARNTGSVRPNSVPMPARNGRYPVSRSAGRLYHMLNDGAKFRIRRLTMPESRYPTSLPELYTHWLLPFVVKRQ